MVTAVKWVVFETHSAAMFMFMLLLCYSLPAADRRIGVVVVR